MGLLMGPQGARVEGGDPRWTVPPSGAIGFRPAKETSAMSIEPVPMSLYERDFDAFAHRLGEAFERYGIAIVAEHGLDPAVVGGADARAKAFFALPDAVKRRYHVPGGAGQRGYTPFGVETAKDTKLHDLKEFWHTGRELPPGHPYRAWMPDNLWPDEVEGFRPYV